MGSSYSLVQTLLLYRMFGLATKQRHRQTMMLITIADPTCVLQYDRLKTRYCPTLMYDSEPAPYHSSCRSSKQDGSVSLGMWHG